MVMGTTPEHVVTDTSTALRDQTTPALRLANVNLYYGAFRAVKDVMLAVPPLAITAIIGPSGCGKSTLLRTLNRMNDRVPGFHHEGGIEVGGIDIYDEATDVVELRRRVGMVFQRPNPFPQSIFDNVAFGLRLLGRLPKSLIADHVEHALRSAALWDEVQDKLHQPALGLSGGQQQRLCIARALATQPAVLLMDEPAAALDPISTSRIEELMDELKARVTIVIVTHNMQQATRASDMTVMMNMDRTDRSGYVVEMGDTNQVFTNPRDPQTEAYITGRFG